MSKSHRFRRLFGLALPLLAACAEGAFDDRPANRTPVPSDPNPALDSRLVPEDVVCAHRADTPLSPEEAASLGVGTAFTLRAADPDEESEGVPRVAVEADELVLSESVGTPPAVAAPARVDATLASTAAWATADPDADCLGNAAELQAGTDPARADSDGDGWFDGPCNERRKLVLDRITAHDEQEDVGDDELYVVVDDVRYPHADLDDYWNFDDGDSRTVSRLVAERTRGTSTASRLANVRLEGFEDDVELTNTWTVDDLLFTIDIDLGAYTAGQTFTRRRTSSDSDYELRFRVDIERFADPNPLSDGDGDADGIRESAEAAVARELGGLTDPYQSDVLVEVDWMSGHALRTEAKRLVVTQLYRHGYRAFIHRHAALSVDDCLTRSQARSLYNTQFGYRRYGAFRYAVMTEVLWNDASGVAVGDAFFMDDSTWWIGGGVLAQAGTLIHELGHTLSLTQSTFHLIDTIGWLSYDSAMNYTFQATMVDYSDDGAGGSSNDHDDWADVDAAYGLRYSFGATTGNTAGVCN